MCCLLVFCAGFYAILWPFGGYIWKSVAPFKKELKAAHFGASRPDVTTQIARSSQRKVLNRQNNSSSIKPNKFHSTYMCFGGRKTKQDREILSKVHQFGSPTMLVIRFPTRPLHHEKNLVSSFTLIGPFESGHALTAWPSTGGKKHFRRDASFIILFTAGVIYRI